MDQVTRNYIEQSLNVKLGNQTGRSDFEFTGGISELGLDELVQNQYTAVEWQDPTSHDCGNNDGILYVYLPAIEDCGELFISVDVSDSIISIS